MRPNSLLAIDPGASSGWAYFFKSMLIACGLGGEPGPFVVDRELVVLIEHPVIYPGGKTRDPNAIVKLAVNAGEWGGKYRSRAGEIRYVEPRTWKGTIDADVCNRRALAQLDEGELQAVEDVTRNIAASKRHNVLDAIGIGLFGIGRWR